MTRQTIERAKAAFIKDSKSLTVAMAFARTKFGVQSLEYTVLSDNYRALRLSFGIKLDPKSSCGWSFISKR